MGRSSKDQRDIHYRLAKEKGYRARSAFKLLQCDDLYGLFTPTTRRVIDLCAAPGSWSQVIVERLLKLSTDPETAACDRRPPRLVSVDLQPVAPVHPICTILKADITVESTLRRIAQALHGAGSDGAVGADDRDVDLTDADAKADLVVCDGAPDVTGTHDLDAHLQQQLLTAALTMACCALRDGGSFVAKVFVRPTASRTLLLGGIGIGTGNDIGGVGGIGGITGIGGGGGQGQITGISPALVTQMRCLFRRVTLHKPPSSRANSWEQFVVCERYTPPRGYMPTLAGDFLPTATTPPAHENGETQSGGVGKAEAETVGPTMKAAKWPLNTFVATGDLSSFDAPTRRSTITRTLAQASLG